jgi:hypothetical protein
MLRLSAQDYPKHYNDVGELPPVPEGFARIYHSTNPDSLASILHDGLIPGAQLPPEKRQQYKENLSFIMGSTGEPWGQNHWVACDLPHGSFRQVNDRWVEIPQAVDPKHFVGYHYHPTFSNSELATGMAQHPNFHQMNDNEIDQVVSKILDGKRQEWANQNNIPWG